MDEFCQILAALLQPRILRSQRSSFITNLTQFQNSYRDKSADVLLLTPEINSRQSPDPVSDRPAELSGEVESSNWETLLQKLDFADKAPPPRQLTDNRRFEFHYEIHGAPGQDERAIGDEVVAVTKTSPVFNGDSSMLDGGQIW